LGWFFAFWEGETGKSFIRKSKEVAKLLFKTLTDTNSTASTCGYIGPGT